MIKPHIPPFNSDAFIAGYLDFKQHYPLEKLTDKTTPPALLHLLHQLSMLNTAWETEKRQKFIDICCFILKQDIHFYAYIADIIEFNIKSIIMRYSNQLCVSRMLDMWVTLQTLNERFLHNPEILISHIRFHLYTGDLEQARNYLCQLAPLSSPDFLSYQQEWEACRNHYLAKTSRPFQYKFAIAILTYGNHADILEACLSSIRERAFYQDTIQILVGNNGSTDKTSEIVQHYHVDFYIESQTNQGIDLYTDLFAQADAEFLIELDDDVVELPWHFDKIFEDYFYFFADYGYLGLNVIENDFIGTEHAKPDAAQYVEDIRSGLVVEQGPTGGWCACMRHLDYLNINGLYGIQLTGESGKFLSSEESQFTKKMQLRMKKSGIIQDHRCLHGVKSMHAYQKWLKQEKN